MARDYLVHSFRNTVNLHIDYAHELNEQQYAAVTALPGPALVIAGAGAGKTRTLTYRVAYLLEQGIPADQVLLLTFTNKAAREMMQRVADLLGGELSRLWGGTFHSIGHRILRRYAERMGYRSDFTILDSEDARHLLSSCLGDANINIKETRFPKSDVLADIFSFARNTSQTISDVLGSQYDYFASLSPVIERLHQQYQERKRQNNVMDFDDLLVLWFGLLKDHPDICQRYRQQFQFILVDEYQDTNKIQSDLIDMLAATHHNVMAVGDDAQSIYAWRGANYQNILKFPERYPGTRIYKIETNYRSTPEVLAVANMAIAPNINQFRKQLVTARKSGLRPALVSCADSFQQAAFVAQRALELREEGVALNHIAVLYRSHFHAMELQMELTRRNIPFSITSGIRFFEQAHIKDLTAYMKWICNPQDELAFKRIVQLFPGIGDKSAAKLWQQCAPLSTPLADRLSAIRPAVPKKALSQWNQFVETIHQLDTSENRQHPAQMVTLVLESGYREHLQEKYQNYRSRLEDLQQLAVFANQYASLEEFLAQLSLLTNVEADDHTVKEKDEECLRLSSIHQAKGLEFDVVFVIMLCDGLFPTNYSLENVERLEEERRLFYVAITRARNELYLAYPLIRASAGYGNEMMQQFSRFLSDIPRDLLEQWNLSSHY